MCKGGVAAGVEHHHRHPRRARDLPQIEVEIDNFQPGIAFVLEPCVDGNEVVDAADLDPVAGAVDLRPIGPVGAATEPG